MHLLHNCQIVQVIVPIDLATADNAGDWINMENYNRCCFIVSTDVGTAGEDPIIDINQATDNAGTATKALDFTEIYQKEGATALSAVGQFTKVTQAAGGTYTSATGGENQQLLAVDIHADMLDRDGGFTHLQLSIADPGGTAGKIGSVIAILYEPRYPSQIGLTAID